MDRRDLGRFTANAENEKIYIINLLLCVAAMPATFLSRPLAWGLLLLPFAHLLFSAFAMRTAKPKHIPELSPNGNVMLRRWYLHYLHPDFCTESRAVGATAAVIAFIGCFYGFDAGLALGAAICLLTYSLVPVFNPTKVLRNPLDRRGHEEIIALLSRNQKHEDVPEVADNITSENRPNDG